MAANLSRLDSLRHRLVEARRGTTLSGKAIAIEALAEAIAEIERLQLHIVDDRQLWADTYQRSYGGKSPLFS